MVGKQHVDVEVHTGARVEDVYALLRDGASWPTWMSIDSFQLERAGAPDGVGAIWIFRKGRVTGRRFAQQCADGLASYPHTTATRER